MSTFAGTYNSIFVLTSGEDPATFTTAALLNAGLYASSISSAWVISNAGSILAAGATVESAGTVTNTGVIAGNATSATGKGILLEAGGSVTNQSGGTVSGFKAVAGAASLNVLNYGQINGNLTSSSGQGVDLLAGGSVTNQSSGTITGFEGIYGNNTTVTVVNAGSIGGGDGGSVGIYLKSGGSVGNTGVISGASGVYGRNGAFTVVNAGAIDATLTVASARGVNLEDGGSVTNHSGATITGFYGIFAGKNSGTTNSVAVVNDGLIQANQGTTSAVGVDLRTGGSLTNQSAGTIESFTAVYGKNAAITLVNYGAIDGNTTNSAANGINLSAGGSVVNQSGASIQGYTGVLATSSITLTNAGAISGHTYAVDFKPGGTDRLIDDPGANFSGTIQGGNTIGAAAVSTLELASGSSHGAVSGFGSTIRDFAQTTIDSGAYWVLTGSNSLASGSTLTNAGTLELSGATLTDAGAMVNNGTVILDPSSLTVASLTGNGDVAIDAGGVLDTTGTVVSTETITFAANSGELQLVPASFSGEIAGFVSGDTLDLSGVAHTHGDTATIITGNTLQVVTASSGTIDLTMAPGDDFSTFFFHTSSDGNGGTFVTENSTPPCFAAGTLIRTDRGDVPVEALALGDRVLTQVGGVRPVRWIGHRRVDITRHPEPIRVRPICFRAGSLGDGVPVRDLYLSPDHAVLLNGALIPARLLLNGASIGRDDLRRAVVYYHVELDAHDVLLAEEAAVESYLDTGNRAMFENGGGATVLHPDMTNDLARRFAQSCAPFADDPATVEPIWRTLAARAETLGWELPRLDTTSDPDLRIVIGGLTVRPLSVTAGRYVFALPRTDAMPRLVSRSAVAAETRPWVADDRCLGVLVRRLTVHAGGATQSVALDDTALSDGWWQTERQGRALCRWTNGEAAVPLPGTGPCTVEIELAATMACPVPTDAVNGIVRLAGGGMEQRQRRLA